MVKMDVLKRAFEELGFENVQTVLATGNVVFEAEAVDVASIEEKLEQACGFAVPTIIRTMAEVRAIAGLKPFKDIVVSVGTRLYVTFLYESTKKPLRISPEIKKEDFEIIAQTSGEVFSVLSLQHTFRTTNAMKILGDMYGKNITTRSWNTVYRILKLEK
jgi:uncharacterized protein (DUF1697 family)